MTVTVVVVAAPVAVMVMVASVPTCRRSCGIANAVVGVGVVAIRAAHDAARVRAATLLAVLVLTVGVAGGMLEAAQEAVSTSEKAAAADVNLPW